MTSPLSPVLAPDSTADTYTTLEGFSGSVAIIEARWPLNKTVCVGTLVSRDQILTAPECTEHLNEPFPLRITFPQAEGTTDHEFEGVDAWIHHDELAIIRLDREVPESVVQRPAPIYFLGGGEDPNLDRSLMATVGFKPGDPADPGRFYSELGALHYISYTAPFQVHTAIDSYPGDRLRGAPLLVRDTNTGDFTVYGIYREHSQFANGPYRLHWSSTWNANLSGDTSGRWQHQDALETQLGLDRNRDGYPDGFEACDFPGDCHPCAYVAHFFWPIPEHPVEQNSNRHAEEALSLMRETDLCDPVPVMRLEREARLRYGPNSQSSKGEGAASAVHFEGIPRSGAGALQYQFEEDVAFRFCSCYDKGWDVEEEECYGASKVCDASEAEWWHEPSLKWHRVDVSLKDGSNRSHVDGEQGGATQTFTRWDLDAPKSQFVWNWYGAAKRGEIVGKNVSGTSYWEADGFLASFVVPAGPQRSVRDDQTRQKLRVSLQYYSFPDFIDITEIIEPAPLPTGPYVMVGPAQLTVNHSHLWVPPKSWFKPLTGVSTLPIPMLALAEDDHFVVPLGPAEGMDVAPFLSPQVRSIGGKDLEAWAKVTAVEPLHFLEAEGRTARFVALARAGSTEQGIVVGERATHAQGLKIRGEGWDQTFGLMGTQGAGLASIPDFQLEHGSKAVFSAWEDNVYVVGGQHSLQRFALGSAAITSFNPPDGVGDFVLAATYDFYTRTIYYVDVEDHGGAWLARLVAYDLENDASKVLWDLPFNGDHSFFSLDLSSERELLFTAGTDTAYTVWRVDPEDGSFLKRMDGEGQPVDAPSMGTSHHVLPVMHDDGHLEHHRYERWKFEEGAGCNAL